MKRTILVAVLLIGLTMGPVSTSAAIAAPLQQGDAGTNVSTLQTKLQELGFFTYPEVTGYFGTATKLAVKNFQDAYRDIILDPLGLQKGTGYVGSMTAAALSANLKKPPALSLTATPLTIVAGSSTTLKWASSNSSSCTASAGWSGAKALSGTEQVSPSTTTTYTLSCTNQSRKTTVRSITVTVTPATPTPDPTPTPVPSISYSIVASAGPNGSISPTGTLTVAANTSPTFTVVPDTGYQIATVLIDGASVATATTYTFTDVTSNHGISVTFSAVVVTPPPPPTPDPTPVPVPTPVPYVPGTPYLVPGSGFTGPTAQPSQVGTSGQLGYDSKTISNWDTVPRDIVEVDRNVGLLAYHISGVSKVLFSANGGPWVEVRSRVLNPETNAEEYMVRLRAADFADGPIEIRAIAVPNAGIPRLLSPMVLYGNYNHTLPRPTAYVSPTGNDTTGDGSAARPYATLVKAGMSFANPNGATVYMLPGDYAFTHTQWWENIATTQTFLTFTPAPGVSRSQVRITTGTDGGIAATLVHLKNLTILPGAVSGGFGNPANVLWVEGSYLQGRYITDPSYGYFPWFSNYQSYVTESEVHDHDGGPQGVLERNVKYYNMWSQAITGVITAVNVYVDYIDRRTFVDMHPDVDHFYGMDPVEEETGIIRYKLTTGPHIVARGFAGPGHNVAYDKSDLTSIYPLYALSMGGYGATPLVSPVGPGDTKHIRNVLFIDTKITGGAIWDESPNGYTIDAKDVLFQNSLINGLPSLAPNSLHGPFSGVTVR